MEPGGGLNPDQFTRWQQIDPEGDTDADGMRMEIISVEEDETPRP